MAASHRDSSPQGAEAISGGETLCVTIRDDGFDYTIDHEAIAAEIPGAGDAESAQAAARRDRCAKHLQRMTEKLEQLRRQTQQGELHGKGAIGVRVGKVINKYKMSKHFTSRHCGQQFYV
jgi:hypothetical protein